MKHFVNAVDRPIATHTPLGDSTTPHGMIRQVEKAVIDPTKVSQLPVGGCFIINRGRVAQVKIMEAPPFNEREVMQYDTHLAMMWHNFKHPHSPIYIRKDPPAARLPEPAPSLPEPAKLVAPELPPQTEQPPTGATVQAKMVQSKLKPRPRKTVTPNDQPTTPNTPDEDDFI